MIDVDAAEAKIETVLMDWFSQDAIMLNCFCMINRKPDPTQETMGIDVRCQVPTLKYNPNFVNTVSLERLDRQNHEIGH